MNIYFKKIKSFLLENKTVRQTVAKNTFWLFVGEIVGRVLRAVIIIYSARVLGAENWGVFSYALSLAAFFTIFSDIGLSAILTRESVKSPELREKYLSTSLFIKLILLGISIIILIFVAPLFVKIEAAKKLLPIISVLLIFDGLKDFGLALNRALEKMEKEALVKIITNFSIVIFGFISLMLSTNATSLTVSYVFGTAVGFISVSWILRKYFKNLISNFSKELIWPIFIAAWPLALLGVLSSLMINTDTLMIGWFRSIKEVGFYSAAQKPILLLYIIPSLFATALFPTFSRLAKNDDERFRQVLEKSILLVLLIAIPIVIGGIVLSKDLIVTLFGSEYLPSANAFSLLLTTLLIVFPISLIGNAIFAYDKQKNFITLVTIGAVSNIFFNYFLIPKYGIEGSAISTIISHVLAYGFTWIKMKKINNFIILPHLTKIVLSVIIMSLTSFFLKYGGVNIFINVIVSATVYFIVLITLKEPVLKEVKILIKV